MKRIEAVNDFVVKFANVNGSGSASANELFAKAILRMGVPVSPRNIFPSQHPGPADLVRGARDREGLPRPARRRRPDGRDEPADLGRRTWPRSSPAATCSTTARGRCRRRSSATTSTSSACRSPRSATRSITDPRQRQLFKNIVYVGALAVLLDIEPEVIEKLFGEQYKGKEKLLEPPTCRRCTWAATSRARTCGRRRPAGAARRRGRRARSSSTATARRRWAACTAAPRSRLVPDHAVVLAGRGLPEVLPQVPRRPGHRQEPLRHRAGRGRARLDRHRDRRRLERRARLHRDLGPGHLADDRVHRPRLLRRDPGRRSSTCSAAAPRPACRRARSRPTSSPAPMPRTATPSTCCCSPRTRTSASTLAAAALDLADRLQTPVFVMTDLDIGMNQRLCEPFAWDDSARLRPRQGDEPPTSSRPARTSAATWTSTATAFRTARCPGTHPSKGSYFTRGTTRDAYARYSERGPDYIYNMERLLKKFETAATLVPQPVLRTAAEETALGVHLFRLDQPVDGRGARRAAKHVASTSMRCACAPFRFRDSVVEFIARHEHGLRGRAEPRRADAQAAGQRARRRPGASSISVLHYDGTPITARFIVAGDRARARLNVEPIEEGAA